MEASGLVLEPGNEATDASVGNVANSVQLARHLSSLFEGRGFLLEGEISS